MANTPSIEKYLTRMLLAAVKWRRGLLAALLVMLLTALTLIVFNGNYSNDVAHFFANDSKAGHAFSMLRQSGLDNQLVLDADFGDNAVVPAEVTMLAEKLADVPGVRQVHYRVGSDLLAAMDSDNGLFFPMLYPARVLEDTSPEKITTQVYRQLLLPSPGTVERLRRDPLGLGGRWLSRLNSFQELSGLAYAPRSDLMISRDGRRAMLILKVDVSCADGAKSRVLLQQLQNELQQFPSSAKFTLIASHIHTVANEHVLKRDVIRVSIFSIIFLLALFLTVYRGRWHTFWIPLFPLAASVLVIGTMTLCFSPLLWFAIGMGGGIIGLAVDQGIHIYAARHGKMGLRRIGRIGIPLLSSVATSSGVFFLLMLTNIPAYRQLGFFAGITLLCSLALFYFFLPAAIPADSTTLQPSKFLRRLRNYAKPALLIWTIMLIGGVLLLLKTEITFDIEAFDGSPETVKTAEQEFRTNWRIAPPPAMLLIIQSDRNRLASKTAETTERIRALPGLADCGFSLTDVFPPEQQRLANLTSWRQVIESGQVTSLEADWGAAAKRAGLSENFYVPFFANLRQGARLALKRKPKVVDLLSARLIHPCQNGYATLIFLPDEATIGSQVQNLISPDPAMALISPTSFQTLIADDFGKRFLWLMGGTVIFVIICSLLCFRSPVMAVGALLPVLSALVGVPAIFTLVGAKLNLMVCFAGMILTGLAIDYGIFGVYAYYRREHSSIPRSMWLSFLTTFFAVGALLFSSHPVLYYTGVTLITGASIAYLTGILVVPAFLSIFRHPGKLITVAGITIMGMMCGCQSEFFPRPEYPERHLNATAIQSELQQWRELQLSNFTLQTNMVMDYGYFSLPVLTVGRIDIPSKTVEIAAISPGGAKFFELAGRDKKLVSSEILPAFPVSDKEEAMRNFYDDLRRVYTGNTPLPMVPEELDGDRLILRVPQKNGNTLKYVFAGEPLRLIEKSSHGFWQTHWRVRFYNYHFESDGRWCVGNAVYKSHRGGYTGIIRIQKAEPVTKQKGKHQ